MAEISWTRNLFLRGMCAVYLFAFLSIYIQIPGLYGNNGVLPARTQLKTFRIQLVIEKLKEKPTLLWLAPFLGMNTEYMMDLLSLLGVIFAFKAFISQQSCTTCVFGLLWVCYLSVYQVGQTFMSFQWDILLLEAGFLTIWVAPWKGDKSSEKQPYITYVDNIMFFLMRWLLFRFLFSSGIMKLQSGCPNWWSLMALKVHMESQPLPTMFAWYLHHAPTWLLKLLTVFTQITEQIIPFLFFFPNRGIRINAFRLEVFLQCLLILSGSSSFFHFLTLVICLSLLDDNFFFQTGKDQPSVIRRIVSFIINIFVFGFIVYLSAMFYSLKVTPDWTIESKITFSREDFDKFVGHAIPAAIFLAGFTLFKLCLQAMYNVFIVYNTEVSNDSKKSGAMLAAGFYIGLALFMFGVSFVPFISLHESTNSTEFSPFTEMYHNIQHFRIANSYGLFRRVPGEGGRPEIIIEGANDLNGPWLEYHFKYKPGDVNSTLPFTVPHQPRLDWQMWAAAHGTYHQNPWLMSTAYRILVGEKSVLQLLNTQRLPFSQPPKFLKASLYHYHYAPWTRDGSQTLWKRESVGEFFPIFVKDHTPLVDYLKTMEILDSKEKLNADNKLVLPFLKTIFDFLRKYICSVDPFLLEWSVFLAGLCIILTSMALNYKQSTHRKRS